MNALRITGLPLCALAFLQGVASAADEPLILRLQVEPSEILPAEPILGLVSVVNVTDKARPGERPWSAMQILIAKGDGPFGPPVYTEHRGRQFGGGVMLDPGKAVTQRVQLTANRYDESSLFPEPGVYRVKVSASISLLGKSLESAEVKIVVKELPPEEREPHRMIAASAEARTALWNGGADASGTLQQLVEKFPKSRYADAARLSVASSLWRNVPLPNEETGERILTAADKEWMKKSTKMLGEVTDRVPTLKIQALSRQIGQMSRPPELYSVEERRVVFDQLNNKKLQESVIFPITEEALRSMRADPLFKDLIPPESAPAP